ncbi:hypothetical protein [Nocardia sp. SYP-A9097]|uniref:hypothetical protein n=1 Tax=Nocardia sp. SYP-A9097 TaxID=2663237 RepID=UPI0018919C8D|nr:hypothetical protein [Nocardia sp. SYP-A9097]
MIVIIGLVILVAAVFIGVAGVFANGGSNHALTDHFAVFGYHVTGSTGVLFLYGIVVGSIGLAGLGMLLTGARRTARLGASARRELKAVRQDTAANPRILERQQPFITRRGDAPTRDTGSADAPVDVPGPDIGARVDDRPPTRR